MNDVSQKIKDDIDILSNTSILNPRRDYLDGKISVDITRSFNRGLIDTGMANKLKKYYIAARESSNRIFNFYKVFDEFERMCKSRCNILNVVELDDILYCNDLCKRCLSFNKESTRETFTSDYFIEKMCRVVADRVENLDTTDLYGDKIYDAMNNFERILFACKQRPSLEFLCEEYYSLFFNVSESLISANNKYYYNVAIPSTNLRDSVLYTYEDEDIDLNPDKYVNYFIQLYILEYKKDYFSSQDDVSKLEKIYENINSLPLSGSNRQLVKSYIDGLCMNYYTSFREPVDFILKLHNNDFEYIVGFPEHTILDSLSISESFTQTFSLDGLLTYVVNYSLQSAVEESRAFMTPEENFNDSVIHHLEIFKKHSIIDDKQMKIIYDKIRK